MTFRRLFTADGIHNYFWKARPVRSRDGEARRTWDRTGSRTGSRSSAWAARRFAEHWDKGVDDLLVEAADEAFDVGRRRPRTTSTPTGSAPRSRA